MVCAHGSRGTTREDEGWMAGRSVGLEYEAYELMANLSSLKKLCGDIRERWPYCTWVMVGEASVVMAISSPHRHDSQQAINHCISQLKANVPIWKKEVYDTQEASWKENSECPWSEHSKVQRENINVNMSV
ncbi:unnamed protein product [Pleuronectes platessa]|uniref:Molybdenum cofactor synthesis protein 2B n=1 Tax=Pleuronectes platessa TaxID=8262 RepID=A0A9N7YY52_PLEPL|nr:unnamed protein product [Pleuronectes platessa]